jgi:hypothetical protein
MRMAVRRSQHSQRERARSRKLIHHLGGHLLFERGCWQNIPVII